MTRAAIAIAAVVGLIGVQAQGPAATQAQLTVSGHVTGEDGRPVHGAEVIVQWPPAHAPLTVVTNASGAFSATVPPVSRIAIRAWHPDFGQQYTAGVDIGGQSWTAYRHDGPVPTDSITLRLRRGVVLRGRVIDPSGRPFAGKAMFLVPAYIGSGPPRIEALTDRDGRFEFERMVLNKFELVPHSLDDWHPRAAGNYLRIAQTPAAWVAEAASNQPIDLHLRAYTLVTVTLDVSALRTGSVQVWIRGGATSAGSVHEVDANGRVQTLIELDVEHELWVVPGTGRNLVAPWTRGLQPQWIGTTRGPSTLRIGGVLAASRPPAET